MPVSKYYGGHGEEVMRDMKRRYGKKRGERVFYATANKHGKKPRGSGVFTDEELKQGFRRIGGRDKIRLLNEMEHFSSGDPHSPRHDPVTA